MRFQSTLSTLALAAAAVLSAPALANGFPDDKGTCDVTDVMAGGNPANGCAGAFDGNELGGGAVPGLEDTTAFINGAGWGTGYTFYGSIFDGSGGPTGTLTLPMVFTTPFVVSLKGATDFALYQFNNSNGTTTLDYDTRALLGGGGQQAGLSHAGLWTAPVPEPETYAMMLAGLAAVGFVARRRRS